MQFLLASFYLPVSTSWNHPVQTHTHTHGDTHTYAHQCTGVYVHTLGITKSSVVTSLDQPRTHIHTLKHIHTHSRTHTHTHTHAHVHWITCTRTCVLNYLHWIVCIRKCARLLQLQSLSQLQQGGQILWQACRTNEMEHPRHKILFPSSCAITHSYLQCESMWLAIRGDERHLDWISFNYLQLCDAHKHICGVPCVLWSLESVSSFCTLFLKCLTRSRNARTKFAHFPKNCWLVRMYVY